MERKKEMKNRNHEPIYIADNNDFVIGKNGVVSGDGNKKNPYIIERWDINASIADGIKIINTDKYFIIRNCIIHDGNDGGMGKDRCGIRFQNVKNGEINNVVLYNNWNGIDMDSSINNKATECEVYRSGYGISMDGLLYGGIWGSAI